MTVSLKHAFTSAISDGADTSLVRPSNWNAEHTLTLGSGKVLGRLTSGTGAVEELAYREVLTADRTYYVRTDGSDSNTGLTNTAGGAFLTIQKAYDVIATLDLNGFGATIKLGNTGTFTTGLYISVPQVTGWVQIEGDTVTPSNTVISVTSGHCILADADIQLWVSYVKLTTTSSGNCIYVTDNRARVIIYLGVEFGSAATSHIDVRYRGMVVSTDNYTISGGAGSYHVTCYDQGQAMMYGATVTLTGTPAFGTFADVGNQGFAVLAHTYSGSATGTRYNVTSSGLIQTNGGGANYLPGNAAGTGTTTGVGYYL